MAQIHKLQGTAQVVFLCCFQEISCGTMFCRSRLFLASRKLNAGFVMMFCLWPIILRMLRLGWCLHENARGFCCLNVALPVFKKKCIYDIIIPLDHCLLQDHVFWCSMHVIANIPKIWQFYSMSKALGPYFFSYFALFSKKGGPKGHFRFSESLVGWRAPKKNAKYITLAFDVHIQTPSTGDRVYRP